MKTNTELVEYCKAQLGKPYWFGTFGQIATEKLLQEKAAQYPRQFSDKRIKKANNEHYGYKVHDCYGLYKGFLMSKSPSDPAVYDAKYDISADKAFEKAPEKGTIDTLPEIAGIGLWKKGHFGVYIGNGKEIEARGFDYGVVEDDVKNTKFTHWFKLPEIEYKAEDGQISSEDTPISAPQPSNEKSYTVQKGDTLSQIGAKFGVSVKNLVEWNNIENPDLILEGQELVIKAPEMDPPADPQKESFTCKVTTERKPLNIRKGAGTNFPVIGILPKGTQVEIEYASDGWGKLYGREGFVSMSYITIL